MRLVFPTDFEILEVLSNGKRNNAVNIAHELDKSRPYVNTRLPVLADFGLVETVGPAPRSGLYVITEKGQVVAELKGEYQGAEAFEARVEAILEGRETAAGRGNSADGGPQRE